MAEGPLVDDDELVVRLIHPDHWDAEEDEGHHLMTASVQSSEFKPPRGPPSIYVLSRAPLQQILTAKLEWTAFGVATLRASELRAIGLEVRYSPNDCTVPGLAHAHASIEGITGRPKRDELVDLLNLKITRVPAPRSGAAAPD